MNAFNPFELLALGLLLIIWVTLTRIERRLGEHEVRLDLLLRHAGIDPSKPAEPSERVKGTRTATIATNRGHQSVSPGDRR
jgi:hypothetical protein